MATERQTLGIICIIMGLTLVTLYNFDQDKLEPQILSCMWSNNSQEIRFQLHDNQNSSRIIPTIRISIFEVDYAEERFKIESILYENISVLYNNSLFIPPGSYEVLVIGLIEGYWPYYADWDQVCENDGDCIILTDGLDPHPFAMNFSLYSKEGPLNLAKNQSLDLLFADLDFPYPNHFLLFQNDSYLEIYALAMQIILTPPIQLNYDLIQTTGIFKKIEFEKADQNGISNPIYFIVESWRGGTGGLKGMNITTENIQTISLGYLNLSGNLYGDFKDLSLILNTSLLTPFSQEM